MAAPNRYSSHAAEIDCKLAQDTAPRQPGNLSLRDPYMTRILGACSIWAPCGRKLAASWISMPSTQPGSAAW